MWGRKKAENVENEDVLSVPEDMRRQKQDKPEWDSTIRTVLLAVLIALVFRSFFLEPFHIPSGSMKQTLLVGDYLFVNKPVYGYSRYSFPLSLPLFEGRFMEISEPERGDVVVFRPPSNDRTDYIKRIIGLPGDTLQMIDGALYINGKVVEKVKIGEFTDTEDPNHTKSIPLYRETLPEGHSYTVLDEYPDFPADNTKEYHVPPGHYFMMGDNRDNSRDSRFEELGYIPKDNIVGRADILFFSTDGSAKWWEFWKWPTATRYSRLFQLIK